MKHSKIYRPLCAITLGASLLVGCAVGNKERSISLTPSPHVLTLDADRKAVFVRGGGKAGFCNLK